MLCKYISLELEICVYNVMYQYSMYHFHSDREIVVMYIIYNKPINVCVAVIGGRLGFPAIKR